MKALTKEEGIRHIERVFDKYTEWLKEDLELYKQSLMEATEETAMYFENQPVFYYNVALDGFAAHLRHHLDSIEADRLLGKVKEILTDEP